MSQAEELNISTAYVGFEREVLHDNIALCDQKAATLMALSAALSIFCLQSLPLPVSVEHALNPTLSLTVTVLGFTLAAYLSLRVIAPRVRGRTDDHIYWMSKLFELPPDKFLNRLHITDNALLERDMALHLRTLAAICRAKYSFFGWAQFVGEFSFLAVVVAEIIRVFG